MLKGISIAANAMKNQTARNDMIANNLANVDTTGFKKDIALFQLGKTGGGQPDTTVRLVTAHEQGPLTRTERALDLAIQGDGFFVVETEDGERYTRAGSFVVTPEGHLATIDGNKVSGAAAIPPGEIEVSREGNISVNGVDAGQIGVVTFEDATRLEKTGSGLFAAPDDMSSSEMPEEERFILSGFLENSNVEVITEMTDMITALKAYEISQKALKSEDEILHLLISTVGKTG